MSCNGYAIRFDNSASRWSIALGVTVATCGMVVSMVSVLVKVVCVVTVVLSVVVSVVSAKAVDDAISIEEETKRAVKIFLFHKEKTSFSIW